MSTLLFHGFKDRAKSAADVKHAKSWFEAYAIENILVFIPLGLSQSLGKIAIVHSAGEICMLSKAHTEDFIHEVIGFFDVFSSRHFSLYLSRSKPTPDVAVS